MLTRVPPPSGVQRIAASIEVSPKQAVESGDLPGLFPRGTEVYVTDLGVESTTTLIQAAKRVSELGYIAVPHIAARRYASVDDLEERLKGFAEISGVSNALVIGGNPGKPVGNFSSAIEVLETGLLEKYGILDVGIAGHPEGSPDFSDAVASEALNQKVEYGERSGLRLRIVTQFGFDPAKFLQWARRLKEEGIDLPIHIGVAGPAKLTTLLKFATSSGVGNSLSFLKKRAGSLVSLASGFSPDEIVEPIERDVFDNAQSNIKQIHVYAFGGIKTAATWLKDRGSWTEQ